MDASLVQHSKINPNNLLHKQSKYETSYDYIKKLLTKLTSIYEKISQKKIAIERIV